MILTSLFETEYPFIIENPDGWRVQIELSSTFKEFSSYTQPKTVLLFYLMEKLRFCSGTTNLLLFLCRGETKKRIGKKGEKEGEKF